MLAAVQVFNNPLTTFKTESFIVLSMIAWTYVLHAYYRKGRIERQELTELLGGPLSRGMRGHMEMGYPPGPYLQDDKNVEQSKTGSDAHEEVASQDGVSVIPNKGHPTL